MDDISINLFIHKTDGGAIYLVDHDNFGLAEIIIRLDGEQPELLKCEIIGLEGDENE